MSFPNFFKKNKSILGVDIGTANIKVAQVTQGESPILETYGIVNIDSPLGGKSNEAAIEEMAGILKTLLNKAGVSTKKCVISFPNSSVFTSVIELPIMKDEELNTAVEYEAKKYVPLALADIDLSWTVVAGEEASAQGKQKILLTAVPKQITQNYLKVFDLAGLQPQSGEIEALALIRSLIGEKQLNCVIIDIGAKATGVNIIEKGFLRLSRNLNVGGDTITNRISKSLNISNFRAEQFKKDFGVSSGTFLPDAIRPVLNSIKTEVAKLLKIYQAQNIRVDSIFLVGGGSNLPGIVDFFSDLEIKVLLGDPYQAVGYNKNLETILKRYSLSLPIAVGLALRKE
ncbi:MAG: hypothetical protein COT92_01340 [Candidatus Doudnabacteria bacterium CG10_big_fil_rev_8_21_14_0_10_42_18]|uniref:SHS2 domain-containing protein n=1 Tax=Candidatus Doudnabacteria bacterium CG10_big_fil_rev_8_21_14_0_10_42_18 TaxID=1974552 RepID=A0A2H0VBB8_9BACT|nr:MAG: hypothetical protein COT92_01340 [Candidatus Doudnabacteria bacterium CG10_big_fil_rev_8_21_14_0_10_42_18]